MAAMCIVSVPYFSIEDDVLTPAQNRLSAHFVPRSLKHKHKLTRVFIFVSLCVCVFPVSSEHNERFSESNNTPCAAAASHTASG